MLSVTEHSALQENQNSYSYHTDAQNTMKAAGTKIMTSPISITVFKAKKLSTMFMVTPAKRCFISTDSYRMIYHLGNTVTVYNKC